MIGHGTADGSLDQVTVQSSASDILLLLNQGAVSE
jgi:hypothetical protein